MALPCTPPTPCAHGLRALTPEALKKKCVSPGDKTSPFGFCGPDLGSRVEDPIGPAATSIVDGLHAACADRTWSDVHCNDAALRVLYDYDAVYGTLGCTSESVSSAVYEVFQRLFSDWGQEGAFTFEDAYA